MKVGSVRSSRKLDDALSLPPSSESTRRTNVGTDGKSTVQLKPRPASLDIYCEKMVLLRHKWIKAVRVLQIIDVNLFLDSFFHSFFRS